MTDNALITVTFAPTLDVPDSAPPLKVDVYNPALSWDDVLPSNFISMENLELWLDERDADSRLLTIVAVSEELLFDPSKEKPADGEWKPVLWFAETESGLVINKTRAAQLKRITRSPLLSAVIGQKVLIRPGVFNGKAQVGVLPVPELAPAAPRKGAAPRNGGDVVKEINDDLFP